MHPQDPRPTPPRPHHWFPRVRALLFLAVTLVSLGVFFYAVENWRGRRAFERSRLELEAKGEKMAWADWLPKPVPDASNFFKAPGMAGLFGLTNGQSHLPSGLPRLPEGYSKDLPFAMSDLKQLPRQSSRPDEKSLASLIEWFQQQEPLFQQIESAAQRPAGQLGRDPEEPFSGGWLHFANLRNAAQLLATRAKAQLLAGQPDAAARSLALLGRLAQVTCQDHPPFLVECMVGVAISGLEVQTLREGLAQRLWSEPSLAACQSQLQRLQLLEILQESIRVERAASTFTLQHWPGSRFPKAAVTGDKHTWFDPEALFLRFGPHGSLLQDVVLMQWLEQPFIEAIQNRGREVNPLGLATMETSLPRGTHLGFMARNMIPNLGRALRAAAQAQCSVRQAEIACALERYRLAHGAYPDSLAVLVPRFLEKIPPDVIAGATFQYRRRADGSYLLYSVGWNQKDDGGIEIKSPDGRRQPDAGDWVWEL